MRKFIQKNRFTKGETIVKIESYSLTLSNLPVISRAQQNIQTMRPSSQSRIRPQFTTKLRSRVNGMSLREPNSAVLRRTAKTEQAEQYIEPMGESMMTFQQHQSGRCMCGQCDCGRHLCKLQGTVYQRSFHHQKPIPTEITYAKEYQQLKGPHLDMHSIYQEFSGKSGDNLQRPRPQDLLHGGGPLASLSSYSAQFPGHRGDNQYVKPTDKHVRGLFPLRSKSTYTKEYVPREGKPEDYKYINDQLKTGQKWLGASTYNGFFEHPNPEYFAKQVKVKEEKQPISHYRHQFETTYKHEFIRKEPPLCPAKQAIEAQGSHLSKSNFADNTDFRSLSLNFHGLSS